MLARELVASGALSTGIEPSPDVLLGQISNGPPAELPFCQSAETMPAAPRLGGLAIDAQAVPAHFSVETLARTLMTSAAASTGSEPSPSVPCQLSNGPLVGLPFGQRPELTSAAPKLAASPSNGQPISAQLAAEMMLDRELIASGADFTGVEPSPSVLPYQLSNGSPAGMEDIAQVKDPLPVASKVGDDMVESLHKSSEACGSADAGLGHNNNESASSSWKRQISGDTRVGHNSNQSALGHWQRQTSTKSSISWKRQTSTMSWADMVSDEELEGLVETGLTDDEEEC
jgi:hypothetical protein